MVSSLALALRRSTGRGSRVAGHEQTVAFIGRRSVHPPCLSVHVSVGFLTLVFASLSSGAWPTEQQAVVLVLVGGWVVGTSTRACLDMQA